MGDPLNLSLRFPSCCPMIGNTGTLLILCTPPRTPGVATDEKHARRIGPQTTRRTWSVARSMATNPSTKNEGEYRNALAAKECEDFGLVRDVVDIHKHVILDRKSRRLTRSDQTGVAQMGYGEGGYGEGAYGGGVSWLSS